MSAEKAIEEILAIIHDSELLDMSYTTSRVSKGLFAFEHKNSIGARTAIMELCEVLINLIARDVTEHV